MPRTARTTIDKSAEIGDTVAMSIVAVTQLKPAAHKTGDVLFGKEFIVEWIPPEFPAHIVDRVCLIPDGYHPRGLKEIACDFDLSSVQYDCPWSKNIYYWMYPICLLPCVTGKKWQKWQNNWSALRNVKIPEFQERKISRTGNFLDCFDPHKAISDRLISAHYGSWVHGLYSPVRWSWQERDCVD